MEGAALFLSQTAAEYGLLSALAAGLVATRDRFEVYVGRGNLKYILIAGLALMVVLLVRWRR